MSWTEGYVTEIEYTHGYYGELSPTLQRFALLVAGFAPPPEQGAYLELGFGQGLSLAIHAAAAPYEVWGTDFNPSHTAHAAGLLEAAGVTAHPFDDSFAEFDQRRDLPKFRYAGLHGVWSWISEENRTHIAAILRRNLLPGGALYISYNTLPGWSAALSLRDLLSLHAETVGAESQGLTGRIDGALAFAQELADKGAAYFRVNPAAAEKLKQISTQNRQYVAHEYFNREWHPSPFAALAEWLQGAKLEFAASVHLHEQMGAVSLTPAAQETLRSITHPILRESVRDFFTNQQFRRDLFVRGPRRLSALERRESLMATRLVLKAPIANVPLTIVTAAGEVKLQEAVYRPILESFAKSGYRPMSLGELARLLPNIGPDAIIEAAAVLIGTGNAHPAQPEATVEKVKTRCKALNREIRKRARSSGEIGFLASPVLGAGIAVNQMNQLFLTARADGKKTPEDWARATWDILSAQGRAVVREGKALATPEENLAELTSMARNFANGYLPVLAALGVAE
ncbi:MAG TPA: class I SAM-dependent methyltransferase [Alphaproteobacteria bacterium]|nr:class I SAM-dependent methyltransferase [Alphaproteobacteria bacterium]